MLTSLIDGNELMLLEKKIKKMTSILSFFIAIKFEKVLELSVIIMRIVLLGDCSSQMITDQCISMQQQPQLQP